MILVGAKPPAKASILALIALLLLAVAVGGVGAHGRDAKKDSVLHAKATSIRGHQAGLGRRQEDKDDDHDDHDDHDHDHDHDDHDDHGKQATMPTGCECLGKSNIEAIHEALGEANEERLGSTYGSYCAAFDDGKCATGDDIHIEDGEHKCGTADNCKAMWGGMYDFNMNQAWCCDSWCYVNRTTCTDAKASEYGITVSKSRASADLYFSYDVCPDSYSKPSRFTYDPPTANYQQFNMSQCPFVVAAPGCECTGTNMALGSEEIAKHGTNYGKWCAAWDDGMCNASATVGPWHTCDGSIAANCSTHWPDSNFNETQNWCCDAWCYVDPNTCTEEVQQMYGIDVVKSNTMANIYFSYGACSDEYSAVSSQETRMVANLAQYDKNECPWNLDITVGSAASVLPHVAGAVVAAALALAAAI